LNISKGALTRDNSLAGLNQFDLKDNSSTIKSNPYLNSDTNTIASVRGLGNKDIYNDSPSESLS